MLVLGIVILAFLVVHLIQFWAKMQLQEIRGVDDVLPPAAGTLFLQMAFQCPWTIIVYIIGFIALWFHMNHGFWSMFQTGLGQHSMDSPPEEDRLLVDLYRDPPLHRPGYPLHRPG